MGGVQSTSALAIGMKLVPSLNATLEPAYSSGITVAGYFRLSMHVVDVLSKGNAAERLALRIMEDIHSREIRAIDNLRFEKSLAMRAQLVLGDPHSFNNYHIRRLAEDAEIDMEGEDRMMSILRGEVIPAPEKSGNDFKIVRFIAQEEASKLGGSADDYYEVISNRLEVEKVFREYREGAANGLKLPLPHSVVYAQAHLEGVYHQEAVYLPNSWYAQLIAKQDIHIDEVKFDGGMLAYWSDGNHKILEEIVANQALFFVTGRWAKFKYMLKPTPYWIFDTTDVVRGARSLTVDDLARRLGMDKQRTLEIVTSNKRYVRTDFGIFPLHFFVHDVADPELTVMKKIAAEDASFSAKEIASRLYEDGIEMTDGMVSLYRYAATGAVPLHSIRKSLRLLHDKGDPATPNIPTTLPSYKLHLLLASENTTLQPLTLRKLSELLSTQGEQKITTTAVAKYLASARIDSDSRVRRAWGEELDEVFAFLGEEAGNPPHELVVEAIIRGIPIKTIRQHRP